MLEHFPQFQFDRCLVSTRTARRSLSMLHILNEREIGYHFSLNGKLVYPLEPPLADTASSVSRLERDRLVIVLGWVASSVKKLAF
jgi:hypothetical protein